MDWSDGLIVFQILEVFGNVVFIKFAELIYKLDLTSVRLQIQT